MSTATLLTPTITAPVLTRDERLLLAAIHAWARLAGWEPGSLPGSRVRNATPDLPKTALVFWGPYNGDDLRVQILTDQRGPVLLDETVSPRTVREAVDLLVAWGILPRTFLSLHMAGGAA